MNRYWIRIALGALLVFGLGLAGLAAVRKGKAQVRSLLTTAATRLPLRFANIDFRLDGRRLGAVTGIDIVRNSAAEVGRVTGHVELSTPDAALLLRECFLTLDDVRHLSHRSSFLCVAQSELAKGQLVEVGEVSFKPEGFTRPLYLPERTVNEWRRSEIQRLDASLERDGRGGVRATGVFDLLDRERGPQRGSFALHADSQGAVFSVRDELDRALVDFRASHNGLHLNVRDRHGRNLLRLLADSLGAALRVNK